MNAIFPKMILVVLIVGLSLAACAPTQALDETKSDQARILEPQVPAGSLDTLVDGNNSFALDLYQSLRTEDGNLFYSPFSISLALAMTYGGARGDTEAQMADVLHFDLSQADLHAAFNQLDLDLTGVQSVEDEEQQPLQLNIANAVWAQQDHPFLPEYLDLLALNYGAGLHLADFTTQAEPTRQEINDWISDQTEERIRDIIGPGVLDALTRMVLVNAIYFKADWQTQFDPNDTHEAPFYLLDDSTVQVDLMSNDLRLPYLRGENFQAVELPYAGGDAVMDIILPDEGQFVAFETGLDWQHIADILAGMQATQVHLEMPKFTFESQFALAERLAGMGMPDAFDPGLADFSGMDGRQDLYISKVIHQAFVGVDEAGTEAAAATVVVMTLSAMPISETQMVIDRPFFFFIRDLSSGQILFFGRVHNPA